jgi:4-amino-4-deoxy-L-arabinose transferase-like glycosyltransferase
MFRRFDGRVGHYALLLLAGAALFLVNLGAPSLWDLDEGRNATAALAMLESDDYVVPRFNGQLRVDKPALLYWAQVAAYRVFGVNEFAARLPSALAALLTLLLTYELGRRLFSASTGLLGGLVLASAAMFCVSAHFANPDALLVAATVLTLGLFWVGFARAGRIWFAPVGAAAGLAVLAKGPVGVVLPGLVILLFLLSARRLRALLDHRLMWGILAFVSVALPWYVWVGVETHGEFLRDFLWKHNIDRALDPMENHYGPPYYYLIALALGFVPWCAFFGPALYYAAGRGARADAGAAPLAYRFLWSWFAVYFVFFSFAATKLPGYILPLYPPTALLTARFLDRWRRGAVAPPRWALYSTLLVLAMVGLATSFGLLVAAGRIPLPPLRGRTVPEVELFALLGGIPLLGAFGAAWALRRGRRNAVVATVAVSAVCFLGALAAWGGAVLNRHKAPWPLVEMAAARNRAEDIRIGAFGMEHLPSLNFYCQRDIDHQPTAAAAAEFLRTKLPVYLFLPAAAWQQVEGTVRVPYRVLGRHPDLYRRGEVVVVTNR